jgi:DNA polymerase/3'-5' exonuclease PolX
MNRSQVLLLLKELRTRLESANYQDFRAIDYVTEIEAIVRCNDPKDCVSKECKED